MQLPTTLTGGPPSRVLLRADPRAFGALIERLSLPEPATVDLRGSPGAKQPFQLRDTFVRVDEDGKLTVIGVILVPTGYPGNLGDPTAVDIDLRLTPRPQRTSAELRGSALGGLAKADATADVDLAQAQRKVEALLRGAGVSGADASALVALARKASQGTVTPADISTAVLQALATVAGIPDKEGLARQIAKAAFETPLDLESHYSLLGLHRWKGGDAFLRAVGAVVSHVLGGTVHLSAKSLRPTGSTGSLPFAHVLSAYGLTWQPASDRYPLGAPMLGASHARHGVSTGVDLSAGAALRRLSTEAVSAGELGGIFEVDLQAQARVTRQLPGGTLVSFSIRGFIPLNEPPAATATDLVGQLADLRARQAEGPSGTVLPPTSVLPQPLGASVTGSLSVSF